MASTMITRQTQKKLLLLLPLAVAGLLAAFDVFPPAPSLLTESKILRTLNISDDEPSSSKTGTRPVMHTFFAELSDDYVGMSDRSHQDLLKVWSSAWEAAGWETKVLGIEDAEKHEDYDRLYPLVDKLSLRDYDKLCYVRWFAMAAAGGFMSDYDVMPLDASYVELGRPEMYEAGKFTVYAVTASRSGVPALVSGSAAEWTRITRALVEDAVSLDGPSAVGDLLPSDFNVLMNIQDKMGIDVRNKVVRAQNVLRDGRPLTPRKCAQIRGKRAVHFSHQSFLSGFSKENRPEMELRPEIVKNWMEMWKSICMKSRVA